MASNFELQRSTFLATFTFNGQSFLFCFFFLTPSFAAAQSLCDTAALSLEGPQGPTTDRDSKDAWRGRKDRHVLALARAAFWYVLCFMISLSFFFANFLFCSSPVTTQHGHSLP